ncbi:MAG: ribonuclease J [Alphaproteobacteria bacterium]|nr:ribonuclease J [Alphaproteobacteria bacterium]
MAPDRSDELVFVPLGGVGEIGMNMAAYGFGPAGKRKWIVVDCGVGFGGPDLPGIELIMADPSFLEDQGDNVLALVVTHSHEDHYGAILDLWADFELPVYCTAFTEAMIRAKRAANEIVAEVEIRLMRYGAPFEIGPFRIEALPMAHSIPESSALHIETAAGRVLHTGDWRLDMSPVLGPPSDGKRLREIGAMPAKLALICDSTNAMKPGESVSEAVIEANLLEVIKAAPHRVAVTTFASNLGRVVAVARAARAAGREVVLAGRALHRVVAIGRELGLLDGVPPFHDQDVFSQLPRNKVLVLLTGSQGEARAALARVASGDHPSIGLDAGDTMLFSSWAIPGNERAVIDIQNALIDKGVAVITNADRPIHASGHPRRDELKQLYDWVRPAILVPVHGEAAHLHAHAAFGRENGIDTVMEIRNGDMVRLFPEPMRFPGEVRTDQLYLDGQILCTPEESGVRDRRRLGFGGMAVVSLVINRRGELVSGPDIEVEGLPELEDEDAPDAIADKAVRTTLKTLPAKRRSDPDLVSEAIRRAVRGELAAYWGKKPNVRVFVHQV